MHRENDAKRFVSLDDVAQSLTKKFQVGSVVFSSMLSNKYETVALKDTRVEVSVRWRSFLKRGQANEQRVDRGISCHEGSLERYSFA